MVDAGTFNWRKGKPDYRPCSECPFYEKRERKPGTYAYNVAGPGKTSWCTRNKKAKCLREIDLE